MELGEFKLENPPGGKYPTEKMMARWVLVGSYHTSIQNTGTSSSSSRRQSRRGWMKKKKIKIMGDNRNYINT